MTVGTPSNPPLTGGAQPYNPQQIGRGSGPNVRGRTTVAGDNLNPIARGTGPNIHGFGPGGFLGARYNPPFPDWVPQPLGVAHAQPINEVARSAQETQAQIAAENDVLRVIYGRVLLGAQVSDVLSYENRLIIVAVWGEGPVDAIEQVYFNDEVPSGGGGSYSIINYTGTQTSPDSTLVVAYAAQSPPITYTDVLPNIAYSVIHIQPGNQVGFPKLTAIVRGLKVHDPRNGFVSLPGTSGKTVTTPHSTAAVFPNDIHIVAKINATIFAGGTRTLVAKAPYSFYIDGLGRLMFDFTGSLGVESYASTVTIPASELVFVRVWLDVDDGTGHHVVRLYTSHDYDPIKRAGTWEGIGTFTADGAITITDSGNQMAVGGSPIDGGSNFNGAIYFVEGRASWEGAARWRFNPREAANGVTSWTASTGEVWTCAATVSVTNAYGVLGPVNIYSDNPALALADLYSNGVYGAGDSINWWGVATAADACDGLVGGEKRRTVGLVLDRLAEIDKWVEALRAYGGLFAAPGGALNLLPDRPSAPVFALVESGQRGFRLSFDYVTAGDASVTFLLCRGLDYYTTGRYIEYEVFIDERSPVTTGASNGGLRTLFSDGTTDEVGFAADGWARGAPDVAMDALARGKWYKRRYSLGSYLFKSVAGIELRAEGDAASGHAIIYYRNIRLTDSNGVTVAVLYDSGVPAFRATGAPDIVTTLVSDVHGVASGICRVKNVRRRSKKDVPTVSAIRYTDTSAMPWRDGYAYAYEAGALEGTIAWKPREVAMPGITRFSHAQREAIEQLNKLWLTDLTFDIEAQDEALAVTIGDVVTVSANIGLDDFEVRVINARVAEPGRPVFSVEAYTDLLYSDSVEESPGLIDTSLPNPFNLTPPTALDIDETVYLELEGGSSIAAGIKYNSRFDISWTAPSSLFPVTYRIELWDGATKVRDELVNDTHYSSPPIQQGKTYTIKVFARNTMIECSTALQGSKVAQGKLLKPQAVTYATGRELGGRVILAWTAAMDIDVVRYEWRYYPNGTGTWDSATLLDRVDGLTAIFDGLPVGTHRFYVKPIDSVGQYSDTAYSLDIVVTSDANSFLQTKEFSPFTGAELVVNGDFSSSTGWTLNTGWSISGGKLIATAVADTVTAYKSLTVSSSKGYQFTFTVDSITSGGIALMYGGGTTGITITDPGTYTFFLSPADGTIGFRGIGASTTAQIDNFTVRERGLVNMVPAPEHDGKPRWITSGGSWSASMPNPLNSGSNPVASYHTSATQTWTGETWDVGSVLSGLWAFAADVTIISGSVAYYVETSADGSTWTRQPGSSWQGATRFARPAIEALTTSTFSVNDYVDLGLTALAHSETSVVTTDASNPTLVQLASGYAVVVDLQATVINTSGFAIADRILVHPQTGLMFTFTMAGGGGNEYVYWKLTTAGTPGRTIQAGDYLEFDVFVDPSTPTSGTLAGGMEIDFTDLSTGRGLGITDQYPGGTLLNAGRLESWGAWLNRKCSLTAAVGKTVSFIDLASESDAGGNYKVLYRNIKITDGAGTTRLALWTSGEPSLNAVNYQTGSSNVQVGPANSFRAYAFDGSGAQAQRTVRIAFKGV